MTDRAATRAFVLGLLALPFGIFAPFAIFSAVRSLRRTTTARAVAGLVAGLVSLAAIVGGAGYWLLAS